MKMLPLWGVVLVTEDAPIWGLSLFRPFGANPITSGAASAQLQPFDQEIWGFWGLSAALGAAALTWLPWDALVCGSCCFSPAPNSVWSDKNGQGKLLGNTPYSDFWSVLIHLNLCMTLNVVKKE